MKLIKSTHLTPYGGLNFVLEELDSKNISKLLYKYLPELPAQSIYNWKDILYSFWSIYFCGGDRIEDLSDNFNKNLSLFPQFKTPSPDRVLERMKSLSIPAEEFSTLRGTKTHEFSINHTLNKLNINILKRLKTLKNTDHVLDYDNTLIFSKKQDAEMTYQKQFGYCPGVGIIGKNIVYVENRNGNSDAQTLQQDTLKRMFQQLKEGKVKINAFRADGASYQLSTLEVINKNVKKLYVKARMNETLCKRVSQIEEWKEIKFNDEIAYRAEIEFTPFEPIAQRNKQTDLLKTYRVIITKMKRNDKQLNIFTGVAYNYSAIITTDYKKTADEIVFFYNQRGTIEKEFDVLKNDFGWNNMPFSKLEQNTVFLIFTAICRNLYNHLIIYFSNKCKNLHPAYRVKKFIFRFICIPAKWIRRARSIHLKLYGDIQFSP